mgnify:FL=1
MITTLINFSILFQFVAAIVYGFSFSKHYLHFRWGVSVSSSNGVMMRYVLVVRVLIPQQRQRIITLEAEIASCKKREKFLVVVVVLLVVMCVILCLLR